MLVSGETVKSEVLEELRKARCYSLLIDETLDIRTTEQMIIYAKYICLPSDSSDESAELKTRFLGIIEVSVSRHL